MKILLRIAAIVLPIVIISTLTLIYFIQPDKTENFQVVSTLKGSKSKLLLDDGTEVWLNSESTLKYPSSFLNKNKRIVQLSGEAFFNVTHDENKPFEVYLDGFKVNVLGTSFNVKAYPEENIIETTLEKGKINIEKFDVIDSGVTKKIVTLNPNETIVLYKNGVIKNRHSSLDASEDSKNKNASAGPELKEQNAILMENIDLTPYISWKENKLVFKSKRLENIIVDLERWYNISISIEDSSLNDIICTATFTDETAEQAIQAICLAAKINYKFNINNVILYSN